MDALLFDFDGVIIDSEPIHLLGFQHVFSRWDIDLTREIYYARYLGLDDFSCAKTVAQDYGREFSETQLRQMVCDKTAIVQDTFRKSLQAYPGVLELIAAADEAGIPLGICSAALRDEIRVACETLGVGQQFKVIVAAEDCDRCKPDPQGYFMTLEKLSQISGKQLSPERSVVIEDSVPGVKAGKAMGARVLAVTTSHPAEQLSHADMVVDSLSDVSVETLRSLVQTPCA